MTYLTSGLLFGREVKRPDWFPRGQRADREPPTSIGNRLSRAGAAGQPQIGNRKIPYTPRPTRSPSVRRPQVERLLLAGRTFKQIAAALGLTYGTILWTAQQVYKQHGVRTLPELLRKHGHAIPPSPTHDVRPRLLAGQSIAHIAAETGAGKMLIYNQRQALRRTGTTLPDGRKSNRVAPLAARAASAAEGGQHAPRSR